MVIQFSFLAFLSAFIIVRFDMSFYTCELVYFGIQEMERELPLHFAYRKNVDLESINCLTL